MTTLWNEVNTSVGNSFVAATSAITMYHLRVTADVLPDRWLHIFDAASTPSTGDRPSLSIPLEEYLDMDFGVNGRRFGTGLVFAISTTKFTFTGDSGAQMSVDAQCYSS